MRTKKSFIKIKDFKRTIDDWCKLRLTMHHQPSSIEAGRKDIGVFMKFCKEKHVRRIGGNTIILFFAYISGTLKNCSGTINRKRATIRCYIDFLRLNQVSGAKEFPIEYLPRARQAYKGPIQTLEHEEVYKLLSSIDRSTTIGLRDFTLYSLLYAIGLRLGEALAIQLRDINFEKEMLTVHGKGNKVRYIPLIDTVSAILKTWISHRKALLNAGSSVYLFLSKKGKPLSGRRAEERFQELVKNAGPFTCNKVTPHSLRHAFASHAVDGNANLLVLKSLLGHASLKTTELYLHPSINTLRKALNDHLSSEILKEIRNRKINVMKINAGRRAVG